MAGIATLYTDTDAIRAALGVSDIELEDSSILNLGMEDQLFLWMEDNYPAHATTWALDPSDALRRTLKLLTMYQGAVFMLPQLQMIAAQKITDSDTEMQRFNKDDLELTSAKVMEMRDLYWGRLSPESTTPTDTNGFLFAFVSPSYDPVTDEG